jgi:hypothetical protein
VSHLTIKKKVRFRFSVPLALSLLTICRSRPPDGVPPSMRCGSFSPPPPCGIIDISKVEDVGPVCRAERERQLAELALNAFLCGSCFDHQYKTTNGRRVVTPPNGQPVPKGIQEERQSMSESCL